MSCKEDFESPMDHGTIALILSIIAVILAASKWICDLHADRADRPIHDRRRRGNRLRAELLTKQTNCFITRGGHLLFLVSCRVYNEGDQVPVTIQTCQLQAKIGHRWQDTKLYQAPLAALFPSLLRNSLPIILKPEERQDFYEIFALDTLIPNTTIKIRLKLQNGGGKITLCRDKFNHRVDEHPVFDILFRVYE